MLYIRNIQLLFLHEFNIALTFMLYILNVNYCKKLTYFNCNMMKIILFSDIFLLNFKEMINYFAKYVIYLRIIENNFIASNYIP